MQTLIRLLLVVTLVGLVCLTAVHIAALAGGTAAFKKSIGFLGPALFVVWPATILVILRLVSDFKPKDLWRVALRGCPHWMRRTVWIIFGYSWAGFFILPLLFGGGMESAANRARVGSAVLMMFYAVAAALSYSALNVGGNDLSIRCTNGHPVRHPADFCEECGAPVTERPVDR